MDNVTLFNRYKVMYDLKKGFVYMNEPDFLDPKHFTFHKIFLKTFDKTRVSEENIVSRGRAKYKCNYCTLKFIFHWEMSDHISQYHPEVDQIDEEEEVLVPYMERRFRGLNEIDDEYTPEVDNEECRSDSGNDDKGRIRDRGTSDSSRTGSDRIDSGRTDNGKTDDNLGTEEKHKLRTKTEDFKKVEPVKGKTYECAICQQIVSYRNYATHLLQHGFMCLICMKTYSTSKDLDYHMKAHKPELDANQKVKIVMKTTSVTVDIKEPVKDATKDPISFNFVPDKNLKYSCQFCDKRFADCFQLRRHEVTHGKNGGADSTSKDDSILTDIPKLQFSCTYCSSRFPTDLMLKDHYKAVHPDPVYPCTHCRVKFSTEELLQCHLLMDHPAQFSCLYCRKKFITEDEVKVHYKQDHAERIEDIASDADDTARLKVYSCRSCNAKFKTEDQAREHFEALHPKLTPASMIAVSTCAATSVSPSVQPSSGKYQYSINLPQKMSMPSNKTTLNFSGSNFIPSSASTMSFDTTKPNVKSNLLPPKSNIVYAKSNLASTKPNLATTKSNLVQQHPHLPTVSVKKYACGICYMLFQHESEVLLHYRQCHLDGASISDPDRENPPEAENKFSCPLCDKKFESESKMEEHCKLVHLSVVMTAETVTDDASTSNAGTDTATNCTEIEEAVTDSPNIFIDDDVIFVNDDPDSQDDTESEKSAEPNSFICSICDDVFSSAGLLAKHAQFHKQLKDNRKGQTAKPKSFSLLLNKQKLTMIQPKVVTNVAKATDTEPTSSLLRQVLDKSGAEAPAPATILNANMTTPQVLNAVLTTVQSGNDSESVSTEQGLSTAQGLSTNQGLNVVQGLNTIQELNAMQGLSTVQGLSTAQGLTTSPGSIQVPMLVTSNSQGGQQQQFIVTDLNNVSYLINTINPQGGNVTVMSPTILNAGLASSSISSDATQAPTKLTNTTSSVQGYSITSQVPSAKPKTIVKSVTNPAGKKSMIVVSQGSTQSQSPPTYKLVSSKTSPRLTLMSGITAPYRLPSLLKSNAGDSKPKQKMRLVSSTKAGVTLLNRDPNMVTSTITGSTGVISSTGALSSTGVLSSSSGALSGTEVLSSSGKVIKAASILKSGVVARALNMKGTRVSSAQGVAGQGTSVLGTSAQANINPSNTDLEALIPVSKAKRPIPKTYRGLKKYILLKPDANNSDTIEIIDDDEELSDNDGATSVEVAYQVQSGADDPESSDVLKNVDAVGNLIIPGKAHVLMTKCKGSFKMPPKQDSATPEPDLISGPSLVNVITGNMNLIIGKAGECQARVPGQVGKPGSGEKPAASDESNDGLQIDETGESTDSTNTEEDVNADPLAEEVAPEGDLQNTNIGSDITGTGDTEPGNTSSGNIGSEISGSANTTSENASSKNVSSENSAGEGPSFRPRIFLKPLSQLLAPPRLPSQLDGSSTSSESPKEKRGIMKRKLIKCPECNKEFRKKRKFENHCSQYPCNICDYKTCRLNSLLMHSRAAHEANNNCAPCAVSFLTAEELKVHNDRIHFCNNCERLIYTDLTVHQMIRSCSFCNFSTCKMSILKKHVASVHNIQHFCVFCKCSFKSANDSQEHARAKHSCPSCNSKFMNLEKHKLECKANVDPLQI